MCGINLYIMSDYFKECELGSQKSDLTNIKYLLLCTSSKQRKKDVEAIVTTYYDISSTQLPTFKFKPIKSIEQVEIKLSIEDVVKIVCDYYNITSEQIKSPTRKRETVQKRQVAMSFCIEYKIACLRIVGEEIGGKDHATALHAVKVVKDLIETQREFRNQIAEIRSKINLKLLSLNKSNILEEIKLHLNY